MGAHEIVQRGRLERTRAGEHLEDRDAERVDVGAMIGGRVAHRLLGRHVGRCPERRSDPERFERRERARRADRFRDTEVGDDGGIAGEENVLRVYVAVDDAGAARVRERLRLHVARDADRLRDADPLFVSSSTATGRR